MKKLFKNCTVLSGEQILPGHSVLVEGNNILSVAEKITPDSTTEVFDLNGDYVVPGFIDLQINGGGGSFFTNDLDEKSLDTIYQSHLEYGTTSYLPTLISTSMDNIEKAIDVTKDVMAQEKYGVLGLHVEGPFFNKIKKGAHFEKFIHNPKDDEIEMFSTKGKGVIKLVTLAPEVAETNQIKRLVESGIKVSAGHSNATFDEAQKGFSAGITKVTHLYNAMSQLNSRNPGLVGAYLNSDAWGAIIVDGVHVDLASVRVAYRLKKGKLFLVSDASFIKHPVTEFEFDGFKIHFKDGNYYTDEGALAGSSISMHDAFKKCVDEVGISIFETSRMASTYPATYLGIDNEYGFIKDGYKADLVILDRYLEIKHVLKNGEFTKK